LLVVVFKGTSTTFFGVGGGPTGKRDKSMDNLMFSCCCAKVDRTWYGTCDCYSSSNTCNSTCLENNALQPSTYFSMAKNILKVIKKLYPSTVIWFSGHSLGGAMASLAAVYEQSSAVAFEAPGELLYAQRINLLTKSERVLPV
jgi:lipase ATG15